MIDLHTHTNESDGSVAPSELVRTAAESGIQTIAVTDHDTFAGYLTARDAAAGSGVEVIRGIEISTRDGSRPIHLLAYFPTELPDESFPAWLNSMSSRRANRNVRLAERLTDLGLPVSLEEAHALGRSITGRVHFARVMMGKGYVQTIQEAFRRFLGEGAPAYVEVDDPPIVEAIGQVRQAGGLPVLAHPGRYRLRDEATVIKRLADAGLGGLEAVHTDHLDADIERYLRLARSLGLLPTGGSDFHGDVKPGVRLGHGNLGQTPIPAEWLTGIREVIGGA